MMRLVLENVPDDPRDPHSSGPRPRLLGVCVEPISEDFWIARGQKIGFTAGASVWVDDADAYGVVVTSETVESGYQRPMWPCRR